MSNSSTTSFSSVPDQDVELSWLGSPSAAAAFGKYGKEEKCKYRGLLIITTTIWIIMEIQCRLISVPNS